MAQSVMIGVIDGTFAGYGLRFAPDSELPVIRDFRAKSIWLSELVELGKSDYMKSRISQFGWEWSLIDLSISDNLFMSDTRPPSSLS